MRRGPLGSVAALVLVLGACRQEGTPRAGGAGEASGSAGGAAPGVAAPPSAPWFVEEAAARGLVFHHASGHAERFLMPEITCGGGALADLDGDGDLDAYLVQAGAVEGPERDRPPNQLFANDGDGRFRDVTAASGAGDRGYGMGVAVGDVDGDALPDLFVSNLGADRLLSNAGGLSFVLRGHDLRGDDGGWSTSATFLDHDRDGDLDLYVCSYLVWTVGSEIHCTNIGGSPDYCGPKSYDAPAPDRFYVNEDGTLVERSAELGLSQARGNGLGVAAADFESDGWPDVFVANDGSPDHLWRNLGGTGFEEVGRRVGVAVDADGVNKAGMGVAVADVDGDLDLDVLVCNLGGETDSLHLNEGAYFREGTRRAKLSTKTRPFTRFGMGLHDFNHDGFLDLYQANGRVERISKHFTQDPYAEPDSLLAGTPDFGFEWVTTPVGDPAPVAAAGRAAAFGDVDGDGDLDVLVVNRDAAAHLLVNVVGAESGHWVRLRVLERSGRDANGATVTLRVGDRWLRAEVRPGYSYLASSDPRVHFGLGTSDRIDSAEVRWLDGETSDLGPLAANREHLVQRR